MAVRRLVRKGPWMVLCERVPAYVNSQYDVEGLCMGFVERLKDVVARKGDRLSK